MCFGCVWCRKIVTPVIYHSDDKVWRKKDIIVLVIIYINIYICVLKNVYIIYYIGVYMMYSVENGNGWMEIHASFSAQSESPLLILVLMFVVQLKCRTYFECDILSMWMNCNFPTNSVSIDVLSSNLLSFNTFCQATTTKKRIPTWTP